MKQMALYYEEHPESSSDEEVRVRRKKRYRDPERPKSLLAECCESAAHWCLVLYVLHVDQFPLVCVQRPVCGVAYC